MRTLALGSEELGAALRSITSKRVHEVLSNGSRYPWFPAGTDIPLVTDRNDRPRHVCGDERTIEGMTLVFPTIFWDAGTPRLRGSCPSFSPYWIRWMAIHQRMPHPDPDKWRDGTILEGISTIAQAPQVGSLRCHDRAWIQASGQLYLSQGNVVANCFGTNPEHHRFFAQRSFGFDPPRELYPY